MVKGWWFNAAGNATFTPDRDLTLVGGSFSSTSGFLWVSSDLSMTTFPSGATHEEDKLIFNIIGANAGAHVNGSVNAPVLADNPLLVAVSSAGFVVLYFIERLPS
jgi:hypothetical protein